MAFPMLCGVGVVLLALYVLGPARVHALVIINNNVSISNFQITPAATIVGLDDFASANAHNSLGEVAGQFDIVNSSANARATVIGTEGAWSPELILIERRL